MELEKAQATTHMVVVVLFTLHILTLRPYRCLYSNILYGLCMTGLSIQMIFMYAKVADYRQSVFVDRFFF